MLLETCKSGVIFDCFASEGFWVFMGPQDTGSYKIFGMEMRSTYRGAGFPSSAVKHHGNFPAREKANVVQTPFVRNVNDNAESSSSRLTKETKQKITNEESSKDSRTPLLSHSAV